MVLEGQNQAHKTEKHIKYEILGSSNFFSDEYKKKVAT